MKKKLTIMVAAVVTAVSFAACSNPGTADKSGESSETQTTQSTDQNSSNEGTNEEKSDTSSNEEESASSAEEEASQEETVSETDESSAENGEEESNAEEGKNSGDPKSEDKNENTVRTKVLNKTGKAISDVTFVNEDEIIGVGSLDDGKSVERKIAANAKDVRLQFLVEGENEVTKLDLDNGFQGSKLVIMPHKPNGYLIDYQGIDEED